jgi:cytochrome oxidase Cu insertion factor (SCO1/SenC/PrrC family)
MGGVGFELNRNNFIFLGLSNKINGDGMMVASDSKRARLWAAQWEGWMRAKVRYVFLSGCLLAVGALWLSRPRVELGTVAGEVEKIGTDSVSLAPDPGYPTFLGRLRRFPIAPVLAQQLRIGDRTQAEVQPCPEGGKWIGKLRFLKRAAPPPPPDDGSLPMGAVLPVRTVAGIDGTFQLGAGQGTPTVLAFLFTSCGMPAACPMLAQKLHSLQEEIRGQGRIVAITLDPDLDTLAALRIYAQRHEADRDTWKLGRLELPELTPLLRQLGVVRVRSGGQIVHSQDLVLLDGHGRLAWRSDGNTWEVAALAARLQTLFTDTGRAPAGDSSASVHQEALASQSRAGGKS